MFPARLHPAEHRAYTYRVTTRAVLPVSFLELFRDHIKRTNTAEDTLLTLYLNAAIKTGENITRRDFLTKTYRTFRDFFPVAFQNEGYYTNGAIPTFDGGIRNFSDNIGFEIRKSPLQSVAEISYQLLGVNTTVSTDVYYNTIEEDYSEILLNPDQEWPEDADVKLQAVRIDFLAGFGADETFIPEDIVNAILEHATNMWKNRGDCNDTACMKSLPAISRQTFLQHRIENL